MTSAPSVKISILGDTSNPRQSLIIKDSNVLVHEATGLKAKKSMSGGHSNPSMAGICTRCQRWFSNSYYSPVISGEKLANENAKQR